MEMIKPLLPLLRVQVFAFVVWLLARLGLPAEQASSVTDWVMQGVVLLLALGYGAWAAWREKRAQLVTRTAALPDVERIVATPALAAKVDDPKVDTR